jgi:hypothetical protein
VNQNNCGNCGFWDNTKFFDDKKGLCKFNAPIFSADNKTRWPVTREQDWCGRHKFLDKESRERLQQSEQSNRERRKNYDRGVQVVKSEPREYDPDGR